jgi:tetratricopeptide (TPR) repeat protein
MSVMTIVFIILGVIIGFLIVFVIKSVRSPKQLAAIADLLKQGKNQQASKAARQLITREPRNPNAHYFLGLCYIAENKPELALMEFKTVNQISIFGHDLNEIEFRQKMAALYAKFNQHEEALKEYLLLIKLTPFLADNYYQAGRIFIERSKLDTGANYLQKAIEIEPRHARAHYELGKLLYRQKKPTEAKNEIETALKCEPENYEAFFTLGKLQKENHDYVGALLAFERAQRVPEYKVKSLIERGSCYMEMNNLDKAVIELERALKVAKDDTTQEILYCRYFLGMCYEKLRELDKACEQWEKIYVRKPAFKDVAEKLSQYQEFRSDDRMKDYLTSSREEFIEICKSITLESLGLSIRDLKETKNGCDIVAVENESIKWRNAKRMPKLLRFLRVPDLIDESSVRALHEDVRNLGVVRGTIITSSGFSRTAIEFAESRPVDLFNKDNLQDMLNRSGYFTRPIIRSE